MLLIFNSEINFPHKFKKQWLVFIHFQFSSFVLFHNLGVHLLFFPIGCCAPVSIWFCFVFWFFFVFVNPLFQSPVTRSRSQSPRQCFLLSMSLHSTYFCIHLKSFFFIYCHCLKCNLKDKL